MSKRMGCNGSIYLMAGLLLFLGAGCATVMTASPVDVKVPTPAIAQKMPLKAAVLFPDQDENYTFVGKPQTPGLAKGDTQTGWNITMNVPLGQMEKKGILDGFSQAFDKVVLVKTSDYPADVDLIVIPKHGHFQYWYKIISSVLFSRQWEAKARISMKFRVLDKKGMLLWEKEVVSPDTGGVLLNPDKADDVPPATASAAAGSIAAAVREAVNAMVSAREIHAYISEKNKPEGLSPGIVAGSASIRQGGAEKTLSVSPGKELSKLAVWDLSAREVKSTYAQELTSILVSEISKLGRYEVYSQENVRTLAGWTAERMTLGCTDTKCLTALGQMDVTKLISGSVGKIGSRYSVSLNLFDTQNAKAENAVSEFGRSEDELIDLAQVAVRKLLGGTGSAEQPSTPTPLAGSPPPDVVNETSWSVDNHPVHWLFHKNGTIEAPRLWKGNWKVMGEGYEVSIPSYGDRFTVKFAPNGKTFTAYKNGAVYRTGVRVGPP